MSSVQETHVLATERFLADLRIGIPRCTWRATVREVQLAGMRLQFGDAPDGSEYCELATEEYQLIGRVYRDADDVWRIRSG